MTLKEYVAQALNTLTKPELEQVAEFVAFVKFRARMSLRPQVDEETLAALCGEFAEEDREMAEGGIAAYFIGLQVEDIL